MENKPEISVIIPIYNEEDNLTELYRRLKNVLENELHVTYEIIFTDDGSKDNSWNIIKDLHEQNSDVKGIKFSRNFGHHFAVTAGIDYCKGDAVVLMDGDLQDPPEEIPKLYEKFREDYDTIYAIRKTRKDLFPKKLASKFFYELFKTFAKVEIPPDVGLFRIISQRVVDSFRSCREKSRFLAGLMSWIGFSQIGVETKRDARYAGKTKYNLFKSIKLALDGITSFSYFPLRIATYIGFFISLISFIMGIYMLIRKIFFGIPVFGYASIIISVLFMGGVQLFIIGVIGEYIGRIYTEVQNRPMYVIKDLLK